MNGNFIAGLEAAYFGVLAIVIVYLFPDRRRELSLHILLCAAVLLLTAVALAFANAAYVLSGADLLGRVSGMLSVVADIAAAAAIFAFLWRWKPGRRNGARLVAILTALFPVWLAGVCWFLTRETALFPAAGTLSLLIIVTFYQRSLEADLMRRAEEVENHQAMVFQWQMRPHFLFNTMNTIRELMTTNPALAMEGLDNLAGYLRKNIDALVTERMIPFDQELAHIEQYVMLEKLNPANQFDVVYDLQIIDFTLPALSIQPLVENAIRHGVRALGEDGVVFVVTERHGEMVRIVVEDNGPGFPGDATEQQKEHASQGLENVRKRLETQCGGSLHIHTMHTASEKNRTRVIVLLPRKG